MAIGIIRFPGTNCDRDVYKAIELAGGQAEQTLLLWKELKHL